MEAWRVIEGDCAEVMARMPEASVDAIVTDPPYGLKFMGKGWDDMGHGSEQQAWHYRWAVEALRVLKPGGHILAFGGTRTYHRLASALEDAGFEIRDQIQWLYGTGFPKSHNISKAIDKAAGVEFSSNPVGEVDAKVGFMGPDGPEAEQWEGWGTALKPAHEPIVLARKPFKGTVAANVVEHGTGGLNIDETRISFEDEADKDQTRVPEPVQHNDARGVYQSGTGVGRTGKIFEPGEGRWPANVILDEEAGAMLDEQTGTLTSGKAAKGGHVYKDSDSLRGDGGVYADGKGLAAGREPGDSAGHLYGDSGGASRFFYCAKASKSEREEGLIATEGRANKHPTVKPVALMEYLVRMVTPPGGVVLDPFTGSGTTGKAATRTGFRFFGIELDLEYVELARARIGHEAFEDI